MPYKEAQDRRDNKRVWEQLVALERYRFMGLEPINVNDPLSPLVCESCFKETHRRWKGNRHEEWCSRYNQEVPPLCRRIKKEAYAETEN